MLDHECLCNDTGIVLGAECLCNDAIVVFRMTSVFVVTQSCLWGVTVMGGGSQLWVLTSQLSTNTCQDVDFYTFWTSFRRHSPIVLQ